MQDLNFSYWVDSAPGLPEEDPRTLPDQVNAAVLGGGIAGLTTAYA